MYVLVWNYLQKMNVCLASVHEHNVLIFSTNECLAIGLLLKTDVKQTKHILQLIFKEIRNISQNNQFILGGKQYDFWTLSLLLWNVIVILNVDKFSLVLLHIYGQYFSSVYTKLYLT